MMEQTQNRISDERLAELIDEHMMYVRAGAKGKFASDHKDAANAYRELTTLRASHKRLVEALEAAIELFELDEDAQTPGADAFTWTYHAKDALAEARRLEGK